MSANKGGDPENLLCVYAIFPANPSHASNETLLIPPALSTESNRHAFVSLASKSIGIISRIWIVPTWIQEKVPRGKHQCWAPAERVPHLPDFENLFVFFPAFFYLCWKFTLSTWKSCKYTFELFIPVDYHIKTGMLDENFSTNTMWANKRVILVGECLVRVN